MLLLAIHLDLAASKHSRDPQNISHVKIYKMRMVGECDDPPSFKALWLFFLVCFFLEDFCKDISFFFFAGISVFIFLTRTLNNISLNNQDLKDSQLCQRADAKIRMKK